MIEIRMKWNVMPLLGDFDMRVGIYKFLQSPPIRRRLPSLLFVGSCSLLATSTVCLHAYRPKGLPEGLQ